ncbi:hypothetical protein TeGR_g14794, partial [Tetraparma gracilis]
YAGAIAAGVGDADAQAAAVAGYVAGEAAAASITAEEWYTASIAAGAQGQADAASITVEEWYTASIAVGAQGEADAAGITVAQWYEASIAGYVAGEAATADITSDEWLLASATAGVEGVAAAAGVSAYDYCLPVLVEGATRIELEGMIAANPLGGEWGPTFKAGIDANIKIGVDAMVKAGVDYEILKGGVQLGVGTATAAAIGAGWAGMTEEDQNAAVAGALTTAITAIADSCGACDGDTCADEAEATFYAGAIAANVGDADAQAATVAGYVAGEAAAASITADEWYAAAMAAGIAAQAGNASAEAADAWYTAAIAGYVAGEAAAAGITSDEWYLAQVPAVFLSMGPVEGNILESSGLSVAAAQVVAGGAAAAGVTESQFLLATAAAGYGLDPSTATAEDVIYALGESEKCSCADATIDPEADDFMGCCLAGGMAQGTGLTGIGCIDMMPGFFRASGVESNNNIEESFELSKEGQKTRGVDGEDTLKEGKNMCPDEGSEGKITNLHLYEGKTAYTMFNTGTSDEPVLTLRNVEGGDGTLWEPQGVLSDQGENSFVPEGTNVGEVVELYVGQILRSLQIEYKGNEKLGGYESLNVAVYGPNEKVMWSEAGGGPAGNDETGTGADWEGVQPLKSPAPAAAEYHCIGYTDYADGTFPVDPETNRADVTDCERIDADWMAANIEDTQVKLLVEPATGLTVVGYKKLQASVRPAKDCDPAVDATCALGLSGSGELGSCFTGYAAAFLDGAGIAPLVAAHLAWEGKSTVAGFPCSEANLLTPKFVGGKLFPLYHTNQWSSVESHGDGGASLEELSKVPLAGPCPTGFTPVADWSACKPLLLCADNEYMKDEACEKCDNNMSFVLVGVSLLSFIAIIYIVDLRAQQQGTMIGIKSITAFYQSAQLTTLVNIPWPKIALWAPFTVPYGDANCLTNQVGWNQQLSFFVREDKLEIDSIYAGLFEWYALERPYWEAVQLFKKLLLVCASSTAFTAAPTQAAFVFGVNLAYLALLEVKKPMPYRPSTSAWFKGQNFFHLVERSSASTSLAGSILAILGAVSRSLVDVLGTIFAIMNIAKTQVKAIEESEGLKPEALEQMKKELKLLQSKVVANIEKELKAASDKGEEERWAVFKEANLLIACIDADSKRLHGDSAKVVGSAEELMVKGEIEKALEKYEKALEMYEKERVVFKGSGATDHGDNGETTSRLFGRVIEARNAIASVYENKGVHGKALEQYEKARAIEWIDRSAFQDCSALKAWTGGLKEGAQVHHEAFRNCNAEFESPSTPEAISLPSLHEHVQAHTATVLAEPFRCLGGPIKSRVTNTAAARNAARLVLWSRWGLLLDTLLRCYIAAESIHFMDLVSDVSTATFRTTFQIVMILFTVPALVSFTLMLDVRPLLEGSRDRKAEIFWMCGSKTSLFGWVYMKLKFLIMFQSMLWLYWFSVYEPGEIEESSDRIEDYEEAYEESSGRGISVFLINLKTFYACIATQIAVALLTYLVMYHCLKRIDQDDRRNVFPSHDYRADAVCCCKPCRVTPLLGCYWLFYAIFFLFFTFVLSVLSVYSNTGSTTAILATCLFGCMVAHQCYYNQEANKVANEEVE